VPSDHRDGAEEGSDLSHYFHFGSNKAGMNDDAADQKRRQEIIYEMSKDSGYFKRAQKVSERNQQRAAEMLQRMRALSAAQRMAYQARCDEDCLRLEARRDLSRICCVVDMDMFFAAVEIRDNPKLRDLPVRFRRLFF
jgi:DNA polymerase kappa